MFVVAHMRHVIGAPVALFFALIAGCYIAAAYAGAAEIFCDKPGGIVSSKSGQSGRAYPCYSLKKIASFTIPYSAYKIICDREGAITASTTGQSGRRYSCYSLSGRFEVRINNTVLVCDEDKGPGSSSLGESGRKYACHTLSMPLIID